MIMENTAMVKQFDAEFDKLWGDFEEFALKNNGKVAEHYNKAYDIWQHRHDPEYEEKLKQKGKQAKKDQKEKEKAQLKGSIPKTPTKNSLN